MRNILLILAVFLALNNVSYAIEWKTVTARNGANASVDIDSIKEYKNYYFYNIKVLNVYTKQNVIITIQSRKIGGLSARINYYKPDEYNNLNGDYDHITDNLSSNFEPVEYGSIVFACYSYVKSLIGARKIQLEI